MGTLSEMYAEQGYIVASMGYSLLNGQYEEANIYRIMDEITACIKAIKNMLMILKFDVNKLKMAIGGYSAGAHLALLYTYLIKDINIIPIQIVINFVGPIGLHEKYFYKLNGTEPLENIDDIAIIEQDEENGYLVPIHPPIYALKFMNAFYGNKYNDTELNSMLYPNGTINKDNKDYQKMYDVVKYAYVTEIDDRNKLPTLCIYGGKDETLGVSTYAYLKQKADKEGRYLYLIYSRYEGHMLIYPKTDDGKNQLKNIGMAILVFLNNFISGSSSTDYYKYFGQKYDNLNYDMDGIINNTFKSGGVNFIEEVGNLNGGNNYNKTDRNIYDLYIPDFALERKNDINVIILFIHGGGWISGEKDGFDIYCKLFGIQGYITATMGYTLLKDPYKDFNIYRLLDEITACIKAIKEELKNRGFDEDNLKLVITGYSAGAHLTLLYSYLIKDIPLPLEFIIDFNGPVGLYPEYYLKLRNISEPLDDISNLNIIEQAKEDNKLMPSDISSLLLTIMNGFYGNKYTQEELMEMLDKDGNINTTNPNYTAMNEVIKHAYITQISDENKTPTIAIYGGIDETIGITDFAYLKQKADEDGRNLTFIYEKDQGHNMLFAPDNNSLIRLRNVIAQIMMYFKEYFNY